ncbi:MAG: hypothetical protein HQK65_07520 [Desulfamplus sp.]|nr:hypothetical protein [Desulfamplus sp.]
MKKITQTYISKKTGISDALLSAVLTGKKRTCWDTAKKLSEITGIAIEIWMENKSNPETLRIKFREYQNRAGAE